MCRCVDNLHVNSSNMTVIYRIGSIFKQISFLIIYLRQSLDEHSLLCRGNILVLSFRLKTGESHVNALLFNCNMEKNNTHCVYCLILQFILIQHVTIDSQNQYQTSNPKAIKKKTKLNL